MRLRWTPVAAEDLESIYVYLQQHRPVWAKSTILTLYEATLSLRTMPERGRNGTIAGTRELLFPGMPYVIVYRITGQTVELVSINHTSLERQTGQN